MNQSSLFDEDIFRDTTYLPTFVKTKSGKGFATVYYDNFIMVTSVPEEADLFQKRMEETEREYDVMGLLAESDGTYSRTLHSVLMIYILHGIFMGVVLRLVLQRLRLREPVGGGEGGQT
jgi:hypothetical protein